MEKDGAKEAHTKNNKKSRLNDICEKAANVAAVTFAMGVLFRYRFTERKIHLMRRHKFRIGFYERSFSLPKIGAKRQNERNRKSEKGAETKKKGRSSEIRF